MIETTRIKTENERILRDSSLYILYVMIYDLLFGKGKIDGGGQLKKLVMQYKTNLTGELTKLKIKMKVRENFELVPEHLRTTSMFA